MLTHKDYFMLILKDEETPNLVAYLSLEIEQSAASEAESYLTLCTQRKTRK
jgi:hypothetical protein